MCVCISSVYVHVYVYLGMFLCEDLVMCVTVTRPITYIHSKKANYIHTCVYIYVYIHMYIYIYMSHEDSNKANYIHTYMHTYIHEGGPDIKHNIRIHTHYRKPWRCLSHSNTQTTDIHILLQS